MVLRPAQGALVLLQQNNSVEFFFPSPDMGDVQQYVLPLDWNDIDSFLIGSTEKRPDIDALEIWINMPMLTLLPSVIIEDNQVKKLNKYIFTRDAELANIQKKISDEYHLSFQVPIELISLSWNNLTCMRPRHLFELLLSYAINDEAVNYNCYIWPHEKHTFIVLMHDDHIRLANAYEYDELHEILQVVERIRNSNNIRAEDLSIIGFDLSHIFKQLFVERGITTKVLSSELLLDLQSTT